MTDPIRTHRLLSATMAHLPTQPIRPQRAIRSGSKTSRVRSTSTPSPRGLRRLVVGKWPRAGRNKDLRQHGKPTASRRRVRTLRHAHAVPWALTAPASYDDLDAPARPDEPPRSPCRDADHNGAEERRSEARDLEAIEQRSDEASMPALITRRKSPSVRIVIGRVRTMMIGRMTAFTRPKKRAAPRRVPAPSLMPGTSWEASQSSSATIITPKSSTPTAHLEPPSATLVLHCARRVLVPD
jgi:hypothetical protein